MRDGLTPTQLALLRSRPQRSVWYLAVHKPAVVANLTYTQPTGHPVSALVVATSGVLPFTNVKTGHTAWLGTTRGGSDLGAFRVRTPIASSQMGIMEAGCGLLNWVQGQHVTVVDEHRPWVKHPRMNTATSQWEMDYGVAYVNQLETFPPYANIGPPIVGVLDATGVFSASFYGDRSLFWDSPESTRTWDFPDSQQVTSLLGTCDNPVVMTFNNASPGGSYFSLTLTDVAGGSHIGRRLIYLMASHNDFQRVDIGSIKGGIKLGGYRAELQLHTNAGPDQYPDGAEIAIYEEASYQSAGSSVGGNFPHRESLVFRGWLSNEVTMVGPYISNVKLLAGTIQQPLGKMTSYDSMHAAYEQGASEWIEMGEPASLTIDRVAAHVLRNRSTVGEIVDFEPMSGLGITEEIAYQDLPKSTFWGQFGTNYSTRGILAFAAADLQSNLYAFSDAQVDGSSATKVMGLTIKKQDRRDQVIIPHEHRDKNTHVQLFAVGADRTKTPSDIPLGAEAPGPVMGYHGGVTINSRGLLVDSQDTLITWAGNLRAKLNNPYAKVRVPLAGNFRLDPVPQARVQMTLSPTDNIREIDWDNEQFLPTTLALAHEAATQSTMATIEMEKVVNGIGGSAYTFPKEFVPTPPPVPDPIPNPTPTPGGTGVGTCYVLDTLGLWRTRALSAASPTWVNITGSMTGNCEDFVLDSWRPHTTAYCVTESGLWKSNNMDAATPTWTAILPVATIETATGLTNFSVGGAAHHYARVMSSINVDNHVAIYFKMEGTGATQRSYWLAVSTDGGTTWTYAKTREYETFGGGWFVNPTSHANIDYLPHLVNGQIVYYDCGWAGTSSSVGRSHIRKSTDSGATWTTVATEALNHGISVGAFGMHLPFPNNEDGNKFFLCGFDYSYAYSTDGGATINQLHAQTWDPVTSGYAPYRYPIEVYTGDETRIYCIDNNTDDAKIGLGYTVNGLNGPYIQNADPGVGAIRTCGGFPFNREQFYVAGSGGIALTQDFGVTWSDKTGDYGGTLAAAHVIVPLWTE